MWFKKKQADPLKTVDEIYREVEDKFNQRLTQLQSTERDLRSNLTDLQKNYKEILSKVREQTDADILLLCKKIEKDILADKKADPMQVVQLNNLRVQQQGLAMQQSSNLYSGLGMLGNAGLYALGQF